MLQQDYIKRLLEGDEMFNNITVLSEDDGNIISQMDRALGIFERNNGAAGAVVIVRQPEGVDEMAGVQFPPLSVEWEILCLEHREMNKDTTKGGTGKRAWHLARRAHRILKAHRAPGILQCLTPRRPTIVRSSDLRIVQGMQIPLVGYAVKFACNEADVTPYTKVQLPTLSGVPALATAAVYTGSVGTVLTVTCATVGASIYYTNDLTNPTAQNTGATLYSGPVTLAAGFYLFRAFLTGSIGSDAVAVSIT